MRFINFVLSFSLFCAFAHADNPKKPHSPKAQIKWLTPFHVVVDFEDGRQAQLLSEELPLIKSSVNLYMTESTCAGFRPQKKSCEFRIPLKLQLVALVWTKFPGDETKIGQAVMKRFVLSESNGSFELGEPREIMIATDFATEDTVYSQSPVPEEMKWSLACEDQKLFQPIQKANPTLNVISLSAEINTTNPETEVDENRSEQSLEDVQFTWANGVYKLQSIGLGTKQSTVLAGQNLHWVVSPQENQVCELAFSNDFSKLAATASEFSGKVPNSKKSKPATWFGTASQLNNFIEELPQDLDFDGVLE